MSGFLKFLIIAFVVLFVIQQSNLFEKTRILDPRFASERDEYRINWNNLISYISNIPENIKLLFNNIKQSIPYKRR